MQVQGTEKVPDPLGDRGPDTHDPKTIHHTEKDTSFMKI